jgi:hypothetical protein
MNANIVRILRCLGSFAFAAYLTSCGLRGSPQYGPAIELGVVDGKKLKELSGMVASRRTPGILWVHNDGSKGGLFALSTNGTLVATFKLNLEVTDLEDIAIGPGPGGDSPCLYVGDIGDNDQERSSVKVYRFPEPSLDSIRRAKQTVLIQEFETFNLDYPGKSHNAEALLVDPQSGDLFIVTKEKKRARVYLARKAELRPGRITKLTLVTELPCPQVSAGDISPNGNEIILRRENTAWLWQRRQGESIAAALARPPKPAAVIGPPAEPNGESITFSADGAGYYTLSEGPRQPIYFFPRAQ